MQIVSAREFRTNQTVVLRRALEGESILLTSRLGAFKITPVSEEDSLTSRICEGLREVKDIIDGKIEAKSAREFLDEL
jgi:antitoxin (DNA-binding transcriptional repressor) of toxin-antitoxin stability system